MHSYVSGDQIIRPGTRRATEGDWLALIEVTSRDGSGAWAELQVGSSRDRGEAERLALEEAYRRFKPSK